MKNANSKRLLTLVLALVLVFALSVGALAAWPSFQNDETNNGVISVAPPTATPISVTPVQLNSNGMLFSGVDVTPVIDENGNAYTLYNGGDPGTGDVGGARLSSVTLSTGNSNWDIQLDSNAKNVQQLSTPYYAGNNTLYAGVTYYEDYLSGKNMSYWNSGAISGDTLSIPANGTVTLTMTGLVLNEVYKEAYFNTGILANSGISMSGSVTLTHWGTSTVYDYGTSYSWTGSEFTLYNQNHVVLPSGTYNVSITLTSNTAVSTNHIALMLSKWKLYKITNTNTTSPNVSVAPGIDYTLYGHGQINTPINAGGDYIYFGIFEGDRNYYQYGPVNDPNTTPALKYYKPSGTNDFYWAGAAQVGNDIVFGSEVGIVYKLPIGTNYDITTPTIAYLTNDTTGAGAVRASVCYDGNNLYVTTKNGFLWKLSTDLHTVYSPVDLKDYTGTIYVVNTTSTPVISDNGYIYVGGFNTYYDIDPDTGLLVRHDLGAIKTVPVDPNTWPSTPQLVWYSDSEAVQSSVIVYSTSRPKTDYLYFTTNGPAGCGRCISYATVSGTETDLWETPAQTCRTYTLQGMASDGGYVVFGNDLNYLYIAH